MMDSAPPIPTVLLSLADAHFKPIVAFDVP